MTMWEQARYLASSGHEVTFVAAGYAAAANEESVDGMNVVRLGSIHSLWLRTFIYYQTKCRARYDVVVVEGFGGSRIPRLAPLYVREPMITEWHQIHRDLFAVQYPKLLNGPLNLLERITARVHRGTLVRAGTEEWRREFRKIGFKPANVFVVPVSIRDDWLHEPDRMPVSEPTILWLGKLRRYKCPDHAIRAMVDVVNHVPAAKLIISGRRDDVAYERELRRLTADLHLEHNVEFRFNVSDSVKRDLLRLSRALVVPSAVEGFGIVVLEANACGVPVIASTGVPEGAVRDGFNGVRYPFGRIDSLATKIVELLTNDDLHAQLSDQGRAFAQGFAWSDVGARYEQVVQLAAGRRPVSVIPRQAVD